jgi:hypothetical protein
MENKKLIYGTIIVLVSIILSVFIWNNNQVQLVEKPEKPAMLPPQISEKCGIENCHGLDIACGPNVPEACTMSYMLGDKCRQYASCEKRDGKCQLAGSSQFESCKSCVKKCESQFRDDEPDKLFTCESKCGE